jgi:hypothetical protein
MEVEDEPPIPTNSTTMTTSDTKHKLEGDDLENNNQPERKETQAGDTVNKPQRRGKIRKYCTQPTDTTT